MFFKMEFDKFWLSGRFDGSTKDSIVEVKSRQSGLRECVMEWEMIQCQMYMLLGGIQRLRYCENFKEESWSCDIYYDEIYVENTLKRVNYFVDRYYEQVQNEDFQKLLFKG